MAVFDDVAHNGILSAHTVSTIVPLFINIAAAYK
jgi:hypothetical protein